MPKKTKPAIVSISIPTEVMSMILGDNSSHEGQSFEYIESKDNPQKVFRLNERQIKSVSLENPILRDQLEQKAAVLGLSFDSLMSKCLDIVIEKDLNSAASDKILNLTSLGDMLQTAVNFKSPNTSDIQIFRVPPRLANLKSKNGNIICRYSDRKLDINLTTPKTFFALFVSKGLPRLNLTPQAFLRALYSEFLFLNGISQVPKANYLSKDYLGELEQIISRIGLKNTWEPYGWKTPPIMHTQKELDNEYLLFSFLEDHDHQRFSDFKNHMAKKKITITFKLEKYDPIRDLLPYVQSRLWRNSSDFFSMLLMQFARSENLFDFGFYNLNKVNDWNQDFQKKLSSICEKRLKNYL